jgi:hypothetical protein
MIASDVYRKDQTSRLCNRSSEQRIKRLLGFLIIALSASSACAAGSSPNKIDTDQAKALVMASLTPKQRQLPSLGADGYNCASPKFHPDSQSA